MNNIKYIADHKNYIDFMNHKLSVDTDANNDDFPALFTIDGNEFKTNKIAAEKRRDQQLTTMRETNYIYAIL